MDRHSRTLAACGLGLLLIAPGCKMSRPEVPPGRPYANDGRQRKAIEFSSDGHPLSAAATTNLQPNNTGSATPGQGLPAGVSKPDAANYGAPPANYGAPGSSPLGQPPSLTDPRSADPNARPAAAPAPAPMEPPVGAPPMPDLSIAPPRAAATPESNPVVQPPLDMPGAIPNPN